MKAKENYDYSISFIRLVSTVLIITCHFMQYFGNGLAWWLNVGVQIFLCMSGYLYGKRDKISDDMAFYRNNFIKILADYYVVIIPVILLYNIFFPQYISIMTAVKALLTYGTVLGGEHLWYISYCLFCYLMTPFLFRYFKRGKHIVRSFLVLSILAIAMTETFFKYFNSAWIFCYILGFFLGNISSRESEIYRRISFLVVVGAVLFNSFRVLQDYLLKLEFNGTAASVYGKLCSYAHVFLGVALFITLKFVFSRVLMNGCPDSIKSVCLYTDKYSYDVYLVHQFFIHGPLSLMAFTSNTVLNMGLIMVIILFCAVAVNQVAALIKNRIIAERAM